MSDTPPTGGEATPKATTHARTPTMPRAVVAGHGSFPAGAVSAVQLITGRGDVFIALSNGDLSTGDIEKEIDRILTSTGARVVFSDLPAGSCTMAARRLMRSRPDVVLVTGASVAMLLDFAMRDHEDPVTAAMEACNSARSAITIHGAPA